jgi:hypothetical protein
MALKDQEACRVAAEEALKAAGVREDMLDRAVRAVDLQPGDDRARAQREAEDLKAKIPSLFVVADASGQERGGVARGREAVRSGGWAEAASAAASEAAARARNEKPAPRVRDGGRQKATQLGWIKTNP